MVVQVRGSKGSGKSTLVRRLLIEHHGEVVAEHVFTNPTGAKDVKVPVWRCDGDLFVLGSYNLDNTSGAGGDRISGPVGRDIIRHYSTHCPHLVWESAFGSLEPPIGERLDLALRLGITWAVLDTPFDECIRRIYGRREERGRNIDAPLNETKERQNWTYLHRQVPRAAQAGIRVVPLPDATSYEHLHDLLVWGGWRCDSHSLRWNWGAVL